MSRVALAGLLALAGVALAACSSAAPATPVTSRQPIGLTVLYSQITPSNLPAWAAAEAGIYAANGLDVAQKDVQNGSTTMAALLSGEAQVALVGGSEALSAVAGGADIVVLAVLTPVSPWTIMVAPEIKSAADIKGQILGTGSRGGSPDVALHMALDKLGLDPSQDVTIQSVPSPKARMAALLSGAIKGGPTHPPESLELEAHGFHALIDLAALHIPAADDCVIVPRAWLSTNRQLAQSYVDSLVQATARMKKDKPFTVGVLEKYLKSTDDKAMASTYDFYVGEVIPALPYPKPEQFQSAMTELGRSNAGVQSVDMTKLLDPSLVASAEQRGLARA